MILSALTPENRLVMRTALVTGLRVGDVLALKPERLKPHFWVTEQKTGKNGRSVYLSHCCLTLKHRPGNTGSFRAVTRQSTGRVKLFGRM